MMFDRYLLTLSSSLLFLYKYELIEIHQTKVSLVTRFLTLAIVRFLFAGD